MMIPIWKKVLFRIFNFSIHAHLRGMSKKGDELVEKLLSDPNLKIDDSSSYTTMLNDVMLWTSNYSYSYGHQIYSGSGGDPSYLNKWRLKKRIETGLYFETLEEELMYYRNDFIFPALIWSCTISLIGLFLLPLWLITFILGVWVGPRLINLLCNYEIKIVKKEPEETNLRIEQIDDSRAGLVDEIMDKHDHALSELAKYN